MTEAPMPMTWDGEAMKPASPYWAKKADERFVIGQRYMIEERLERSAKSHQHYFANLHEAWMNLPEKEAERFPTVEHLRKFALIKTGHYDSESLVLPSHDDALRVASFVRRDDFTIVVVSENLVVRYTAKSQSARAMDKGEFQKSKDDVLAFVWGLVGVDPATGNANAGQAA